MGGRRTTMDDPAEELLNVYDAAGAVVDARPRRAAKASGLAVGAVNALVVNGRGEVLLQRRPADKENGARWDKSVGGHVSAGEEFDATARARGRRGAVLGPGVVSRAPGPFAGRLRRPAGRGGPRARRSCCAASPCS